MDAAAGGHQAVYDTLSSTMSATQRAAVDESGHTAEHLLNISKQRRSKAQSQTVRKLAKIKNPGTALPSTRKMK